MITHEVVEQAIKEWQSLLRLNHWELKVEWDNEEQPESSKASIRTCPGRFFATLCFRTKDVENETLEELNNTICHEMIHLHLDPIGKIVESAIESWQAKVQDAVMGVLLMQSEYAVDGLAKALSDAIGLVPVLKMLES